MPFINVKMLAGRSTEQKRELVEALTQVCTDLAMQLLREQLGVTNFAPLKESFLSTYSAARAVLPTLPSLSPYTVALSNSMTLATLKPPAISAPPTGRASDM